MVRSDDVMCIVYKLHDLETHMKAVFFLKEREREGGGSLMKGHESIRSVPVTTASVLVTKISI